MAGRECYYNYAGNIRIGVKLSEHRKLPNMILSEIVGFYGYDHHYPTPNYVKVARQQYSLAHVNERNYLIETNNEIVISTVTGSELRLAAEKQYINFTLVYSKFGDKYVVPLIDPISGSCFFQISLHWAITDSYKIYG